MGQRPGNNQTNGAKAAQPVAANLLKGIIPGNALSGIIMNELPAWGKSTLQGRAKFGKLMALG